MMINHEITTTSTQRRSLMHSIGWILLLLTAGLLLWTQVSEVDEGALDGRGAVVVVHNNHRQDTPMSAQSSSQSSLILRPTDYQCPPCDRDNDDDLERYLPQFAIIGAMKSGTSALAKYLRNHPNVAKGKGEGHILDNHKWFIHDARNTTMDRCRILQAYKEFFSDQVLREEAEKAESDKTTPPAVLFDKSPNYLLESHILPTRLVCAMAQRTKLVVIKRPTDNRLPKIFWCFWKSVNGKLDNFSLTNFQNGNILIYSKQYLNGEISRFKFFGEFC